MFSNLNLFSEIKLFLKMCFLEKLNPVGHIGGLFGSITTMDITFTVIISGAIGAVTLVHRLLQIKWDYDNQKQAKLDKEKAAQRVAEMHQVNMEKGEIIFPISELQVETIKLK